MFSFAFEDVEVRVDDIGGDATAWRWSADADAVAAGRRVSLTTGIEAGRGAGASPLEVAWISPAADETLLVKEEIAQPVQEAASLDCGVLIRGVADIGVSAVGGGSAVSGNEEANLRTLCK